MAKGQGYKPFSEWSNKRKENHIKYDQEKYSVIGAKMPRAVSDSFRALCKAQSVSVSAALSVFVRACIQFNSLDVIRDDDGTTAAGSIQDNDGRRDDIPGRKNIDTVFPQGDQANENDTPGTVDSHPWFDTPGTVD